MVYQERLLLYADVLGWSAETRYGDGSKLLSVVRDIHKHTESHNQRAREELISQRDKGDIRINPMALEVQFGAFSDHFVFSVPDWFGDRILTKASQLMIELLRAGFLTRGAVVLGPLYHCDNVIFGPALCSAVEIEEGEAFFPRILVSDDARDRCSNLPNDPRHKTMIKDQMGRFCISPFAVPFEGSDELIESLVRLNFFLPEIQSKIHREIVRLESERRHREAEKSRYLDQFIAGPVLNAAPQLRCFWH